MFKMASILGFGLIDPEKILRDWRAVRGSVVAGIVGQIVGITIENFIRSRWRE